VLGRGVAIGAILREMQPKLARARARRRASAAILAGWSVVFGSSLLAAAGCGGRPLHVPRPDAAPEPDASAPADVVPEAPKTRVPYRALSISVGRVHACAVLDDHALKCWGDNSSGQLGLGDTRPRGRDASEMGDALPAVDLGTGRTAVAVAARSYATCALLDDGSVKCWGQLGTSAASIVGDQPGELGDHLARVDLGGRAATSIALGDHEACAATADGGLVCWEYAVEGPLGPTLVTWRPTAAIVGLAGADSVVGLFADGSIARLPARRDTPTVRYALADGEHARAIYALDSKGCALLDTGGLRCWPTKTSTDPPSEAPPTTDTDLASLAYTRAQSTCWLTTVGRVKCHDYLGPWATPTPERQVGIVKLDGAAAAIDGGGQNMTCALLDDGHVKCWGAAATAPCQGAAAYSDAGWPAVDLGTRLSP
jgi:hypothetical protein